MYPLNALNPSTSALLQWPWQLIRVAPHRPQTSVSGSCNGSLESHRSLRETNNLPTYIPRRFARQKRDDIRDRLTLDVLRLVAEIREIRRRTYGNGRDAVRTHTVLDFIGSNGVHQRNHAALRRSVRGQSR